MGEERKVGCGEDWRDHREGRISPGGSIGVAQRCRRGSKQGELALPRPPPSTSCPRASDGQDQKDNSDEEGGYKRQLS